MQENLLAAGALSQTLLEGGVNIDPLACGVWQPPPQEPYPRFGPWLKFPE